MLRMRKVPTNRATAAKISRKVVKKLRASRSPSEVSFEVSAPVLASRPSGMTASTSGPELLLADAVTGRIVIVE